MMIYLIFFLAFILAIILGRLIIPGILLVSFRKRLFDAPDARKKHKGIVPRLGGIAFVPVQFCIFSFFVVLMEKFGNQNFSIELRQNYDSFLLLFCGLIVLYMVGVVDDLVGVNFKRKFLAQFIAAALMTIGGVWINNLYGIIKIVEIPAIFGIPFTIFSVILIVNAINLIDGLDGLSSGLVATGCLTLGCLFLYYGAYVHALFAIVTAGVLIPFFYYNVFGANKRRHRIFMGDTGSLTLGYSLAFLSISYTMLNKEIKPFSEGAIIVAYSTIFIPVMDVATVMWLRLKNKKSPFMPDRNHIHHRILRCGMSNHGTMITILAIAIFFGVFNVIMVEYVNNNFVLAIDVLLWILMNMLIALLSKKNVKKNALANCSQLLFQEKSTEIGTKQVLNPLENQI